MTILSLIRSDYYKNTLKYPASVSLVCQGEDCGRTFHGTCPNFCSNCGMDIGEDFKELTRINLINRKDYNDETQRLHQEFEMDLYRHFEVVNNPKRDLCFSMAWDRGYSAGLYEVYSVFEDLVELIKD